jgi:hypothetical protein
METYGGTRASDPRILFLAIVAVLQQSKENVSAE